MKHLRFFCAWAIYLIADAFWRVGDRFGLFNDRGLGWVAYQAYQRSMELSHRAQGPSDHGPWSADVSVT